MSASDNKQSNIIVSFNSSLQNYDATGLAELIRTGQISREEAFDFSVQQIEQHNPALNAVIRTRFDKARIEMKAADSDAPFAGVPFLTKDLMAAIGGEPLGFGSGAMKNYRPPVDSELVKRFRKAGLVILGQTNTPELGLMGITEPKANGPSRNPWNTDRTPGGSSGGTAAAVAARIVPMASGGGWWWLYSYSFILLWPVRFKAKSWFATYGAVSF
ncbi:amidase [Parendozoicomonas sp. Alg238-R29]|uniref:amidase n=1 Tax=Parendozoicomonas sp. Alg238-R29 TaxID=2993446 RepID=UPI00248EF5A7|nr:amidase [Parendozoicomonas sp. Alg238-R29]